ncbi:transglycosylase SLT domain-containing protein [bacterium]
MELIINSLDKEYKQNEKLRKNNEKIPFYISISTNNALVLKHIRIHTKGSAKKSFSTGLTRFFYYKPFIEKFLLDNNMPQELVYLPLVESLYNTNAKSRAGAVGLWQLMRNTGKHYGIKVNYWIDERRDPLKSTIAALKYLKYLHELFDDWELALAAYNRGHYGIKRDIRFSKATDYTTLQKLRAIPSETENFVPKFVAYKFMADNYKQYGFKPKILKTHYKYDNIALTRPLDLKIAAKCAETSLKEIRLLNPQLQAWCTPPNHKNFLFKLPHGKKEIFKQNLAKVKNHNPSRGYIKYKVRRGDCLGTISKKFNTTVKRIKIDNKIKNSNKIRTGKRLIIRPGRKYYAKKR